MVTELAQPQVLIVTSRSPISPPRSLAAVRLGTGQDRTNVGQSWDHFVLGAELGSRWFLFFSVFSSSPEVLLHFLFQELA